MANIRTFPAVPIIMFGTFERTGIAYCGADHCQGLCLAAAQAKHFGRCRADGRTFHVELNAAGHHLNIFFFQAGAGAMPANGGTAQTSFDTGLI